MNKRSYVISALIILGMIYSMSIGPGWGPGGAIQSGVGRIVVLADDCPICDDYWDTSTRIFTLNTFDWLTEFSNGKRILKDSHFETGLTYNHMVNTLQTNGYTVDINDTSSLTLSQTPILLETYDVLLMKVGPIDNTLLTEYVNSGGSVFLVGGNNGSVPNQYDEFLVNFGMSLFTPVNPGHVTLASFVPHPVTTGVSSLETLDPTPILVHSSEPLILATWGGWNWLVVYSEELTNIAPTVTVVSPNGGEYWLEMRTITWTATDPQGDPLTYTVYYSPNGGQSWTQLATGLAESSYQWDTENYYQWNTTTVVGGKNSLIQLVATDGTYIGVDISPPFEIANEQITSGAMQWERTYGGSERDNIRSIIETTDGGYALTGCTWSFGANSGDLWLVKTDSRGEVEWTQIYGNWYTESAYAVIQTQDGGFALVSATGSADESWLVKTDAGGEMEWTQTYGSNSEFYDVIQTRDGGYALVGSMSGKAYVQKTDTSGGYQWSWTYGGGAFHSIIPTDNGDYVLAGSVDYDACLVKITTSGVPLWTRTYGGTREQYYVDHNWVDRANTVIQTTDGGFALAGVTSTGYFGAGWYDAWVVKTDAWGMAQWTRTYGGSGWDEANAVIQTADGGFTLAGVLGSDAWLVIMDARGEVEWTQTFAFGSRIGPISEDNCFYDGIQTTDGEFALAGATIRSSGTYGEDGWLVKTTLTANEPTACGDVQWERTYGGSKYDVVHSVIQTMDGGYALAGFTQTSETNVNCEEFWLVKTDAIGNEQWTQTYGGSEVKDTAFSVIQTTDDGFALTGSINGSEWTKASAWLVKTDANGIPQWNQTYGGHEWDWAEAIIQTADGGFALTGWTRSYGAGEADFWLVKTDARGAMEWEQTYGGTGDDFAFAVIETTDGGFALAGSLMVPQNRGYFDAWLVKTYPNGTVQWNQTYGGSGADNVYAIIETADGGYAIAGDTNSYGVDRHNFWLVKIDTNGEAQWNQTYGGSHYDTAYAVIETPDGGFTLIGYTRSFGAGGFNGWLVKTDDYGDVEWTQTYGSSADDYVHSGIQTADGGFVLAGWTESFGTGSRDGWLVKTIPLDTDGDGLPDGYEIEHGLDLTVIDSGEDPDHDGLATLDEYRQGTKPRVADSDGDGLLDGEEVAVYKTDPLVTDSDGDSYSDGEEVDAGFDPNDPVEYPSQPLSTPPPLPPATITIESESPAFFIPGFTLVELGLALACLVGITRRVTKR